MVMSLCPRIPWSLRVIPRCACNPIVGEIVLEAAILALVGHLQIIKTLVLGVPNSMVGIKVVANASCGLKVVVMPMLSIKTPVVLLMLAFGRSIAKTGMLALVVLPLVTLPPTLTARLLFGDGDQIRSVCGQLVPNVVVAKHYDRMRLSLCSIQ